MQFQNIYPSLGYLEIGSLRHSEGKKDKFEIPCLAGNIVEHLH
jgi:hypothetical protein